MSEVAPLTAPAGETHPDGASGERELTLESLLHRNPQACYQCAKCTASCPYGLEPHRVMRLVQMDRVQEARKLETPEACAGCSTCVRVCPKGLSPMPVNQAVAQSGGKSRKRRVRSRIFGHINRLARAGSRAAPVSNWLLQAPGARLVNHHLLGIHKARSLPPYARPSFPAEWEAAGPRANGEAASTPETPPVLFFHDTFTDYHFPGAGWALTRLLGAAGQGMGLADNVCCGRPMLSKGFEEEAVRMARDNVERLHEAAERGQWIVGLEPSCLLTVRDAYPDLLPAGEERDKARAVAERARMADEFLEEALNGVSGEGPGLRRPDSGPERLLLHTHCHQKTYADPDAGRRLLEGAGYTVLPVSAHCCGMAGSYGAERENFQRSERAFQEGVGLAMKNHPDVPVAITGASCRMQIADLAGDQSRHALEWLADALPDDEGAAAVE